MKAERTAAGKEIRKSRRGLLYELKSNKCIYLMALPVALYYIILCYMPM